MAKQREVGSVPGWVRWLLPALLVAQIAFRLAEPAPAAVAAQLGPPPALDSLRLAALGEPIGLAVALSLRLQAFDTQPGVSIPFRELDYQNIERWLDRIVMLDPHSAYPFLLASQLYSQVPDEAKQRIILDFVFRKFREDPVRRWRWLAHASIIAKHRLGDLQLALIYARAIATDANDPMVPSWARQMHIFLLEDLGEHEAAKILLGGLLASGTVNDANEARFLMERLEALEPDEISTESSRP
ncbi:MAG: hypothetical protein JSU95_11770 [Betaproteobacteria bacterium]|nr:MAG: hypothetical protein JSU95_11770 [Betaproteobacteria bacterium]